MLIWKRKPYWSTGRWLHAAWGLAGITIGGLLWGDGGLVCGFLGVSVLGAAWEIVNHWWPLGPHMYADVVDYLAFIVPATAEAVVWVLLTGGVK